MSERLEEKVNEHDRILIEMQTLFKGMAESQSRLADNVGEMAKTLNKMDLWLERLTMLDINTRESFKRSYGVIKEIELDLDEKIKKLDSKVDSGFKDLEVATFFSKHPKLLIATVVGLCMLNIEPIRKIIFGG